jgi:hypothetical protein
MKQIQEKQDSFRIFKVAGTLARIRCYWRGFCSIHLQALPRRSQAQDPAGKLKKLGFERSLRMLL